MFCSRLFYLCLIFFAYLIEQLDGVNVFVLSCFLLRVTLHAYRTDSVEPVAYLDFLSKVSCSCPLPVLDIHLLCNVLSPHHACNTFTLCLIISLLWLYVVVFACHKAD